MRNLFTHILQLFSKFPDHPIHFCSEDKIFHTQSYARDHKWSAVTRAKSVTPARIKIIFNALILAGIINSAESKFYNTTFEWASPKKKIKSGRNYRFGPSYCRSFMIPCVWLRMTAYEKFYLRSVVREFWE